MQTILILSYDNPDPRDTQQFTYRYGFPKTALQLASCVELWGASNGLKPVIVHLDSELFRRESISMTDDELADLHEKVVMQKVLEFQPEMVMIVAPYSNLSFWALNGAKACRKILPGVPIITGGPHATFVADQILRSKGCPYDAIILGAGEEKLQHILKHFDQPEKRFHHPGIQLKRGRSVRLDQGSANNILEIPEINYQLLPSSVLQEYGTVLLSSRGCAYRCRFCVEAKFWRHSQHRFPAKQIRKELTVLTKKGVPVYGFGDSMLDLMDPSTDDYCAEVMNGIPLDTHFFLHSRLNSLDKKGCNAFQKNGGRAIWVGLESASANIIRSMHKGITINNLKKQLEIPKQAGLNVGAYFMFGFPGETEETARQSLTLMRDLFDEKLIDYVDTLIFTPYPGLPMFNKPQNFDMNPHRPSWTDWSRWGRVNEPPVYDLEHLSRADIFYFWKQSREIKSSYDLREKPSTITAAQ